MDYTEADYIRSGKNKHRQQNANHLLNFSFNSRPQTSSYQNNYSHSKYQNDYSRATAASYSKDRFLQANFQFVTTDDFVNTQDADQIASWDQIKLVIYYNTTREIYLCPICLDEPKAPKITKCGHIFCWVCLLHLFEASVASEITNKVITTEGGMLEVESKYKKCPLCTEMISLLSIKNVKILFQPNQYSENKSCTFQLLKRHKLSVINRPVDHWCYDKVHKFPYHFEDEAVFSRFHLDTSDKSLERQILLADRNAILQQQDTADETESQFVETALVQINNLIDHLPPSSETSSEQSYNPHEEVKKIL